MAPYPPDATSSEREALLNDYMRQTMEHTARKEGSDNALWKSAQSMVWSIDMRWAYGQHLAGNDLEVALHTLWFAIYHGAKHTAADSPAQSRLVLQLVQLQARGALYRYASTDTAQTDKLVAKVGTAGGDAILWADLPFLVADMAALAAADDASLAVTERTNIAHFFAQLAIAGVARDGFAGLGLAFLHDALETPRPLGKVRASGENPQEPTAGGDQVLAVPTMADLLPAVLEWLGAAGDKIIALSGSRWDGGDSIAASRVDISPGPLFRGDTPDGKALAAGFSPRRWIFWLRRLEAIASEAAAEAQAQAHAHAHAHAEAGEHVPDGAPEAKSVLAEQATKAMDMMFMTLFKTPSEVRGAFDAAPDVVKYRNPVLDMFLKDL